MSKYIRYRNFIILSSVQLKVNELQKHKIKSSLNQMTPKMTRKLLTLSAKHTIGPVSSNLASTILQYVTIIFNRILGDK